MPKWVKDEPTWKKAKDVASKADATDPWALTTYLYKKMSGEIAPKEAKSQPGIGITNWFWAADTYPTGTSSGLGQAPKAKEPESGKGLPDAHELAQNLLLESPDMSAATFYNLLKSKGIELVKKELPQKEADSASSVAKGILAGDEKKKESGIMPTTNWRFIEGTGAKDNGIGYTKFKVALIQEGLGNLGDAFYYTRQALESAVPIFEGKKCFADHPSKSEDQDRPERSVRDVIGHFENVRLEEGDQGQAMVCADLVVLPDKPYEWARALVRHAVDYSEKFPDKQFVGLSINASGDAEPQALDEFVKEASIPEGARPKLLKAIESGVTQVKVVNAITDAVSCDIVTEPGARGMVIQMLEGDKEMEKKEMKQAAPEGHEDVKQDMELIDQMLKKHGLIDDKEEEKKESEEAEESEEKAAIMKHAEEAIECYKEMGYSEEEAHEAAGHAMKLAKHMAMKKAKQAEESEEAEESKKESGEESKEAEEAEESEESEKKMKKMEAELIRLRGENASLRESGAKTKLAKYVDDKLAESKLPMRVTKQVRESIGEVKTEKDFDRAFKLFMEGYKATGGSGEVVTLSFVETEKQAEAKGGTFSFANCLAD